MYKTIRHGENSLQYTILPQNDDFRIEGKLTNASCQPANAPSGASTSSSSLCSSAKRGSSSGVGAPRRRRTFFAYLGLIFVCTVIIGAVLIPFLVSAECLPSPTEWFLKTKAVFTHSGSGDGRQPHLPAAEATSRPAAGTPPAAAVLGQNVGKTVQIINRNGTEQFILKINKTVPVSSRSTATAHASTTTPITPQTKLSTITITTTTAAATTTLQSLQTTDQVARIIPASTARSFQTATTDPVTSAPSPLNNRLTATLTTRIIQVPLLKSAAKKPIMPPVLAKTQSTQLQQLQEIQQEQTPSSRDGSQNKSNNAWVNTRWAYIDPSTYVQWSGYKAEDSVLLPALLGFALIGMILIITVCLVARNKRTIVSSVRKRNRNDIEEHGAEDNATLLTTTNLSDDD